MILCMVGNISHECMVSVQNINEGLGTYFNSTPFELYSGVNPMRKDCETRLTIIAMCERCDFYTRESIYSALMKYKLQQSTNDSLTENILATLYK